MADALQVASFTASIPPIMSGIKTGADGMRFQLDVPETEMGEAVKLVMMRGKLLRVTIEVVETGTENGTNSRRKGKRGDQ